MGTVRSDDDARLLEQRLVVLRWIVAAFGAVQVGFAIRDRASDPTFVLPLGVALVVGLTVGNVAIAAAWKAATSPRACPSFAAAASARAAAVSASRARRSASAA